MSEQSFIGQSVVSWRCVILKPNVILNNENYANKIKLHVWKGCVVKSYLKGMNKEFCYLSAQVYLILDCSSVGICAVDIRLVKTSRTPCGIE